METVACGPNHLWCIGRDRSKAESKLVPARTLQEVKKLNGARRSEDASPSASDGNIEVSVIPSPTAKAPVKPFTDIDVVATVPVVNDEDEAKEEAAAIEVVPQAQTEDLSTITHELPEPSLQIQTVPNALADSLIPLDAPTPSTVEEFAAAGAPTPSSAATDTFDADTPLSPRSGKPKIRGIGMIRGISLKFRRRFGGKKRSVEASEGDAESETETGHNEMDQAK